ncbi:DUF5085 family protein [Streptococcus suis]|uniref:DUF5085 family protein n=1 Tax=Streptococcus suis TaxID=1307 RepID=UPI0003F742C7|nr:DUF5085 family protein [Streptococcus suis]
MRFLLVDGVVHDLVFSARNVVRRRETFAYEEMETHMKKFVEDVEKSGGTPTGTFFYSLNNTPFDEVVDIEFFISVDEDYVEGDNLLFSSYFEVNNTIQTTVKNDFETLTEIAYARLIATIEHNQQDIRTPFYHVINKKEDELSVTVVLGYAH